MEMGESCFGLIHLWNNRFKILPCLCRSTSKIHFPRLFLCLLHFLISANLGVRHSEALNNKTQLHIFSGSLSVFVKPQHALI